MPEKLADDRKAERSDGAEARETMPQIMQPHAFERPAALHTVAQGFFKSTRGAAAAPSMAE